MAGAMERTPRLVGWGITNRCNLSCPHCYSSASRARQDELTTEECLNLLDSLARMGTKRIGWTGGEPLLRVDLEDLIDRCARLGIESGITTNGVPLTPRRAESLRAAGLGIVQISLDGSTSERNGKIRLASAIEFERVLRAIRVSREAGFAVHMAMLVGAETLDDVRDYLALASELGVESVRLCGFVPWGMGSTSEARQRLDLRGRLGEVRALVEEVQDMVSPLVLIDPGLGPLPPDFEHHECVAGVEMLYVSSEGDVYPCTSLLHERFRVGNVRQRPIEAIWSDPRMTEMALYPRDRIHGACRDCDHFPECGGGCRGIAHAYTGDLNASLPLCMARANEAEAEPSRLVRIDPSFAASERRESRH
jgi:radical SAM protein with 4Fe4S-binding SPASM domain